jgi:hypothetical protein
MNAEIRHITNVNMVGETFIGWNRIVHWLKVVDAVRLTSVSVIG